ncbi:MAG: DNA repair protein RecN [Saprospiraceae bacterium]|nr:DNA repair protein RecN [Saprospiraceae bacterium]MCB9321322.1 DNA repair protein RecN [Lewinellaceae bacterium]
MLVSLYIKNYAIIKELQVQFSPNLNVITGETGAGKSILMGALGLLLGDRADTKSLFDPAERCVIEGTFIIDNDSIADVLQELGLEDQHQLVIRRELTPQGKTRAFINDALVNLSELRGLSDLLVDVHAQFDTLEINEQPKQLELLDAYAGILDQVHHYRTIYRTYLQERNRLQFLRDEAGTRQKELDFWQFQLAELTELQIEAGEEIQLEQEQEALSHAEEIRQRTGEAAEIVLNGSSSLVDQLNSIAQSLRGLYGKHPMIEGLNTRLEQTSIELADLAEEWTAISEKSEFDPERYQEIQERLGELYRLFRKHQVQQSADLLAIQHQLQSDIDHLTNADEEIEALARKVTLQEQECMTLGKKLHDQRQKAIPGLQDEVVRGLHELAMDAAQFKIDLTAVSQLQTDGIDTIELLFSANKGSRLLPIKRVASGGELSRLNLVLKSLVASKMTMPTLIFDEIDTGISGFVSDRMGVMMRALAQKHQILCITHAPQIASKGDHHYFVFKEEKANRTETNVKLLGPDERITELAIMLSTNPPTTSALANARELLANHTN